MVPPAAVSAPLIAALMVAMRAKNCSRGIIAPTSSARKAWPWLGGSGSSATQLCTSPIIAEPVSTAVRISTSTARP